MRSYTLYCILIILILCLFIYFRTNKDNFQSDTYLTLQDQPNKPQTPPTPFDIKNKLVKYGITTNINGGTLNYMTIDNFYSFDDINSVIFFETKYLTGYKEINKLSGYTLKFFLNINDKDTPLQQIVNSKKLNKDDNKDLWSLKYKDGHFYLQIGNTGVDNKNTNYKFENYFSSADESLVFITISYYKDGNYFYLVSSIHGEISEVIRTEITPTTTSTNDTSKYIIMFGSNNTNIIYDSNVPESTSTNTNDVNNKFNFEIGDIYFDESASTKDNLITIIDNNFITCKYKPIKNDDDYECILKCKKQNNCDQYSCSRICNLLNVDEPGTIPIRDEKEPDPPEKIRIISKETGFIIEFKKPAFSGINNAVINYYIIVLKKTKYEKDNNLYDTKFFTVNAGNTFDCEYTLDGLDNNTFYDIYVLSKNNKNLISPNRSNIETASTLSVINNIDNNVTNYNDTLCNNKNYKFISSNIPETEIIDKVYKNNSSFSSYIDDVYDKTSIETPILSELSPSNKHNDNTLYKTLKDFDLNIKR